MSEDPEALFATARRAILDKRPDLLQELLERTPELARARNESGEDLLNQTLSYANFVGDQVAFWTSTPCAELLIRAGATVAPETCLRAIYTADAEMVQMFLRLKAIPPSLRNTAAAGNLEQVRGLFTAAGRLREEARPSRQLQAQHVEVPDPDDDQLVIADAFRLACRCGHSEVSAWLLERAMERSTNLGSHVEAHGGTGVFLEFLLENRGHVDVLHHLSIWELAQLVRLELALGERDLEGFQHVLAKSLAARGANRFSD